MIFHPRLLVQLSQNQTFFEKLDLILAPRPNHQAKNDRKWILELRPFHQNHNFLAYFTIDQATFHEKTLFHFQALKIVHRGFCVLTSETN